MPPRDDGARDAVEGERRDRQIVILANMRRRRHARD
jgi:hypothetical protein